MLLDTDDIAGVSEQMQCIAQLISLSGASLLRIESTELNGFKQTRHPSWQERAGDLPGFTWGSEGL